MKKSNFGSLLVGAGVLLLIWITSNKEENSNPPPKPAPKPEQSIDTTNYIPDKPWPLVLDKQDVVMERNPVLTNYYVIFDASGSMKEKVTAGVTKIEAGKRALVTFAHNLSPEANLGLLSFEPVRELLPLGTGNRSEFVESVGKIEAVGRTPLVKSMLAGFSVLTRQAQRQSGYGRYVLVIVTDGASSDGNPAGVALEIANESPIEIQAIGFGVKNHALNVPGVTQYVTANSPEALVSALNKVIESESESFVDPDDFVN